MLVSLAKIKACMSITGTTHDTLLTSLIQTASARLSALLGTTLESTTYTDEVVTIERTIHDLQSWQKFDLAGASSYIFLENYPVSTFTSIKVDGDALTVDDDYYVLDDQGVLILTTHIDTSYKSALATYTAGYAEDSAPEELNWIVCEMVKDMFRNSGTVTQARQASSEKIGEYAITYAKSNTTSSPEIMSIINKYRRYAL